MSHSRKSTKPLVSTSNSAKNICLQNKSMSKRRLKKTLHLDGGDDGDSDDSRNSSVSNNSSKGTKASSVRIARTASQLSQFEGTVQEQLDKILEDLAEKRQRY
jgi:DNA-directed RNA polymerase alpha subunit